MDNLRGISKLKQVLINDKHFNPMRLNDILKSEIYNVLKNYMEITKDDIIIKIDIEADGTYVLRCKAKCSRIKILGIIPS